MGFRRIINLFVGFVGIIWLMAPAGVCAKPAIATEFRVLWKISHGGDFAPVLTADNVVLRTGDVLRAHDKEKGKEIWTQTIKGLKSGPQALAGSDNKLFALNDKGLVVLEAKTGKILQVKQITNASGIVFRNGSVYLSDGKKIVRVDEGGRQTSREDASIKGELQAVEANHVVVHQESNPALSPKSSNRLLVVDLDSKKAPYSFKLLPGGSHKVLRMAKGKLAFIDYSRKRKDGSNSKLFYFTEVDFTKKKRVRDISISKEYLDKDRDEFDVLLGHTDKLILVNYGTAGQRARLFVYDLGLRKVLWSIEKKEGKGSLVFNKGKLWSIFSDAKGGKRLVVYEPQTGKLAFEHVLPPDEIGKLLATDRCVLVSTNKELRCFVYEPSNENQVNPTTNPAIESRVALTKSSNQGWQLFRDPDARYEIMLPPKWQLRRQGVRHLGGERFVIPFVKTVMSKGTVVHPATIHVLVREAAGQDVRGLWKSVYNQRLRRNPGVRVHKVRRLGDAVLASYSFRARGGVPVQMRSFCIVRGGRAYELRAWASLRWAPQIWQEIITTFKTFKPLSK